MKAVTKFPVVVKAQRLACDPVQPQNSDDAVAGRVERRLAAILAADVAGYSRLVGADEQGTLARWRAHWDELIEPVIREHDGRVVRITGDGILAEFASVVNAVRCAVAFQRGMAERNADIAPDQRIAKKDIVRTTFLRRSLMPEGLEARIGKPEMADLIAFLRGSQSGPAADSAPLDIGTIPGAIEPDR